MGLIGAGIATALILGAIYRHQYRPCYYGYPYYGYSYYRPVYRGYYAGYYRPRWHYHHHRPYGHFYRRHRHCSLRLEGEATGFDAREVPNQIAGETRATS
jgi:hypothetical protein